MRGGQKKKCGGGDLYKYGKGNLIGWGASSKNSLSHVLVLPPPALPWQAEPPLKPWLLQDATCLSAFQCSLL